MKNEECRRQNNFYLVDRGKVRGNFDFPFVWSEMYRMVSESQRNCEIVRFREKNGENI